MTTIALGVVMFTVVILALVAVLLLAKAQLVNTAEVTITINGQADNALKTPAGSTLLNTLTNNRLFLPSACGGKGTCGVCVCKVTSGGGSVRYVAPWPDELASILPLPTLTAGAASEGTEC